MQAYLRNLPTLVTVFAEKYEEAALENRNAEAKEVEKTLGQLRDSRKLLPVVGLAQLLDLYVTASLQLQRGTRSRTSSMRRKNPLFLLQGRSRWKLHWCGGTDAGGGRGRESRMGKEGQQGIFKEDDILGVEDELSGLAQNIVEE